MHYAFFCRKCFTRKEVNCDSKIPLSPTSFFWDGGGEGSGPALWIPQCSVYPDFKVQTCSTRKRFFLLFQVTSSHRFVKTGKSMEILKNILEFGDIPPRFVFVILATNISTLIIILHISPKNGAHWSGYKAPDFKLILWYPFSEIIWCWNVRPKGKADEIFHFALKNDSAYHPKCFME